MNKLVLTFFVFSYSAFFLQSSYAEDNFDFANTAKLVCEYGENQKRKSVCKDMVNQSIVAAVEIGRASAFCEIAKNNGEKINNNLKVECERKMKMVEEIRNLEN